MIPRRAHPGFEVRRRGVALLLVLAVLVVTVTALAALARAAASRAVAERVYDRTSVADGLLGAAEDAALDWLQTQSARVVLSPDAAEPRIAVLDDAWTVTDARGREQRCRVRITAWDEEGMVPWTALKGASPLRQALPDDVREVLDRARVASDTVPGLDVLAATANGGGAPVFPDADETSPAVGAIVATHDPLPATAQSGRRARARSSAGGGVLINVTTAPVPLLRAAMRQAGRSGLEQILASRAQGEVPPAPAGVRAGSNGGGGVMEGGRFVSASSMWGLRFDVTCGNVNRSWWAVYTRVGSKFTRVQRLAIDE